MSASSVSRVFCNVIQPHLNLYMLRLKSLVIFVWIFVVFGNFSKIGVLPHLPRFSSYVFIVVSF